MTKVYSFWEHFLEHPEQYVTEEENIKFNYNNWMKKGIKMNDQVSQDTVQSTDEQPANADNRLANANHVTGVAHVQVSEPKTETTQDQSNG